MTPPVPPRLVATDLDGTLVRSNGTVSRRTAAALARVEAAGAVLVLVTGRPPRWLAPVSDQLAHRGLAICANGALVYDLAAGRVVEEHLMRPVVAEAVVAALRAAIPELAFAVERADRFGYAEPYRPRFPMPPGALAGTVEQLVSEPAAKLLVRHEGMDADTLLAAAQAAVGSLATLTHSSRDGLVEISAAGVSKATTLELLAAERGIGAAEVIAFGDMPNDLPMLAWAGHSVAVANAHPSVLTLARETTRSNNDDGVAIVLERLFPLRH